MIRERRRFWRLEGLFGAQYRLVGQLMESWRQIRISNLSAGGIRFTGEDLLEAGAPLELRIELPTMQQPLLIRARVIWSQSRGAGVAESGAAFADVNPAQLAHIDSLVSFLKKSVRPPAPPAA